MPPRPAYSPDRSAAGLTAPLYGAVDQPLVAGAVYSVFVVGAPDAAVGILRKDR